MLLSSHSDVIEAFGGVRPLAEAIGVDPKRAIHWSKRGIPAKYWIAVEDVAATKKVAITARQLSRMPAEPPNVTTDPASEAAA